MSALCARMGEICDVYEQEHESPEQLVPARSVRNHPQNRCNIISQYLLYYDDMCIEKHTLQQYTTQCTSRIFDVFKDGESSQNERRIIITFL